MLACSWDFCFASVLLMLCVSVQDWRINNRLDLWQLCTRKKKNAYAWLLLARAGWKTFGVFELPAWNTSGCCTGGGSAWITFIVSFWYFSSTCCCLITGKPLNFFLVQEGQNRGRRWIGSVLLCHAWLQRRKGLHGGDMCSSRTCGVLSKSNLPACMFLRRAWVLGDCTSR